MKWTKQACFCFSLFVTAVLGQGIHRIAFGSCANPSKGTNFDVQLHRHPFSYRTIQIMSDSGGLIWKLINSFHPNHFISLGDIMYADWEAMGRVDANTPKKIVREFSKLTADKHWQQLIGSAEHWSATYDDHDYGSNNADKTFQYRNFSQQTFRSFAKQAFGTFDSDATEGVYSSKTIHAKLGQNHEIDFVYKLILVDVRSNKDPRGTPGGAMLDEPQWQWLTRELADTELDLIIVGSPIQMLPDDTLIEEKWADFPAERNRLLALVTTAAQRTNVILLSGDVHRAEISQATCTLTSKSSCDAAHCGNTGSSGTARDSVQLLELTSSGLSHTMAMRTSPPAAGAVNDTEEGGDQDGDGGSAVNIPVYNTWWFVRLANAIYQFAYPGYYREDKQRDVYYGIHFALLDFARSPESSTGNAAVEALFSVVSHTGEVVMRRAIPLRARSQQEHLQHKLDSPADAGAGAGVNTEVGHPQVTCVPYWGEVPTWRRLLYRAIIAAALLGLVVLPLLAILWLVGASLYYVLWGSELARRDEIERRYREHKKTM